MRETNITNNKSLTGNPKRGLGKKVKITSKNKTMNEIFIHFGFIGTDVKKNED